MVRRRTLILALLASSAPLDPALATSGMVTEIVSAGYRPVDELITILEPMVPKPGSVSGAYGKIVIRTTPENMREIKEILASLDRAPANLLVSVRHSMNEEVRRDLYETFGEASGSNLGVSTGRDAGSGRGLVISSGDGDEQIGVRIDESETSLDEGATQRVRVLEGKEAFIRSGQSVPMTEERVVVSSTGTTTVRRSTGFRNIDSGFYVRARLNAGDRVTVEVFPQRNRLNADAGRIDVREASTVVTSRLGRWMQIGGISSSSSASLGEIGASSGETTRGDSATYLKVERLDR